MVKVLRLGRVDEDVSFSEAEQDAFLRLYHHAHGFDRGELRFRDDCRNCWYAWEPIAGQRIRALTQDLQATGFMPNAEHSGIFGYATQSAVRLFQEYVRTIGSPDRHVRREPPSWPDGVVGEHTRFYLDRYVSSGERCRWANDEPRPDFIRWMTWLHAATEYYRENPTPLMRQLTRAERRGDSYPPDAWRYREDEPHLIGIRRRADARMEDAERRPPDDLFVLLIRGMSFYFWGSSDSNPRAGREGYLIEGQHRYRFNWHNISPDRRSRIYKAARPAGEGVMVVRDVHGDNALSDRNRRDGFDAVPNPTFNLHWSGMGLSNWSAGCQVISGKNYINDTGDLINCAEYAARSDSERGERRGENGPRLTMGAYSVLSDLLLTYTPVAETGEKPTFRYSLFREEAFDLIPGLPARELGEQLHRLRNTAFY